MHIDHALVEFYGCIDGIDDADFLISAGVEAAKSVNATILDTKAASYPVHGTTVVIFLAESHIILTTWPEHNQVLADILLCNPDMPHAPVISKLSEKLCPTGFSVIQKATRHIGPKPED